MSAPHWAEAGLQRELGAPGTAVEFSAAILNSVSAHIAVLDQDGVIVATNDAWRRFASKNGLTDEGIDFHAGIGTNYLDVCRNAAVRSIESASLTFNGIRQVLEGTIEDFSLEYPCHSPDAQHWFSMSVTPIAVRNFRGAVVVHDNITDRKLAEHERLESETPACRIHRTHARACLDQRPRGSVCRGERAYGPCTGNISAIDSRAIRSSIWYHRKQQRSSVAMIYAYWRAALQCSSKRQLIWATVDCASIW